ncbi:MAG: hypothetical protein COW18_06535 [Zetaproteobacteria bacterium CG12_big_fil_rev_8_21_14_0_65_54_13]|nr:MAG: hypothetical protein COX55_10485 [Zetaproteobacteria bacterium CG23_combo_of_CG06-09_8_20_14_all_54_7]PIW48760.1 MAG: hypothetical protein COW18_06535 [Zetaproteobacteria bacterium CG12_big_fil_rev_8_21_14_0_65_54_13]PIX53241.1 MAG: hypothetical protein COZ50_14475 [Zetaproteobacteria bacterium CG_4_10_14_3_um_filter_54_28]PJA30568.1 MAG: hypothetical protein CO188_02830 [Zetaproteobacteria bacterium CG_4_9_14_3_um_filter_54_145]
MPKHQPSCYLYCEACDYQQDVAKVMPKTPFTSVDELRKNVGRFHCSVCGAKHVIIREAPAVPGLEWW